MLIQEMINEGYVLKSWFISHNRNQKLIALKLVKKSGKGFYHYTSSSPTGDKKLSDAHFTIPCLMENIQKNNNIQGNYIFNYLWRVK